MFSFFSVMLLILLGSGASASTMSYYTPGGAPCDGACGYEWAVNAFDVPEGEIKRMSVPAGSIVRKMSYARDGVPYAMGYSAILTTDQSGEGYEFEQDGVRYIMFKLDVCQNWAVFADPLPEPVVYGGPGPVVEPVWTPSEPPWRPMDPVPVVWVPRVPPTVSEPPPVSPVPVPAAAWLLASGIAVFGFMKGKKHVQSL